MMDGRVDIDLFVGMLVMVAVGGGPPERATLHGAVSKDCEKELAKAGCLEGAMREIAVVKSSDREHSDEIKKQGCDNDGGIDTNPEDGEAADMEKDKRKGSFPIDLVRELGRIGGFLPAVIRI